MVKTSRTKIMDQPDQLEPLFVRVLLTDPLRGLERVHYVRQVKVRVALVHLNKVDVDVDVDVDEGTCQLVEHVQCLHDGSLHVVELEPFLMFLHHKGHCLQKCCPIN